MRSRFPKRALGFLPLALLVGPSCSLLYDLSPDQCGTNTDCGHFGLGFTCDNGVCVCHGPECQSPSGGTGGATNGGSANGGGTSGRGGNGGSVGANGGDAGMSEVGGGPSGGTSSGRGGSTSSGGKGGKGGSSNGGTSTSGDAGMGGMVTPDECTSHKQCFDLHNDSNTNPYACVSGQCQPLLSEDCPLILPYSDNGVWSTLKTSDAVILGGFSGIPIAIRGKVNTQYDLALTELSNKISGVYPGNSSKRHELVMVVCDASYLTRDELIPRAAHLIDDLNVKGIVGYFNAQDQQYIFETIGHENEIFFIQTLYSDQALINLSDDGLVWHMLSGANALSVSVQPLLDKTEQHLRTVPAVADGATNPLESGDDMRVYMLRAADDRLLADLGTYFSDHVSFNGKLAKENVADDNFTYRDIPSAAQDDMDPQTDAINGILAFKPHVVYAATMEEMLTTIIPGVESSWDAATVDGTHPNGLERPFYILSPLAYNLPYMGPLITGDTSSADGKMSLFKRIIGINWPSAVDTSVYDDYWLRYQAANPDILGAEHLENFYDAAYYLMYAVAGADWPVTGSGIAAGMRRLITNSAGVQPIEVGPVDEMSTYVNFLHQDASFKFKLIGAQGPPNWDSNGGRTDAASIWCVSSNGTTNSDVMRYDPANSSEPLQPPTLAAATSCYDFP